MLFSVECQLRKGSDGAKSEGGKGWGSKSGWRVVAREDGCVLDRIVEGLSGSGSPRG